MKPVRTPRRKRSRTTPDRIETVRVERPIAPSDTRYEFCVDDATMEQLAAGVCPEALAGQCHALLAWKREGQRAIARRQVSAPVKPYAVVETTAKRRATQ